MMIAIKKRTDSTKFGSNKKLFRDLIFQEKTLKLRFKWFESIINLNIMKIKDVYFE